jgi:hypothetical protein
MACVECGDPRQVAVTADKPCIHCEIAQTPNSGKTACQACPSGTIRDASGLACLEILNCPLSSQLRLVDQEDAPLYFVDYQEATVNDGFEAGVNFSIIASPPRGTLLPLESTTITYTASSTNEVVPSNIQDMCTTTVRLIPGKSVVVETLGLLRALSKHREVFAAGSSLAGNRILLPRLPIEILAEPVYALTVQSPPNLDFLINLDQVPESSARLVISITYCTLGFEVTNPDMYGDSSDVLDVTFATAATTPADFDIVADYSFARTVVDPLRGVCLWLDAATRFAAAADLEEGRDTFYQLIIAVRQVENLTEVPTSFGDLYPLVASSVYLEVERELFVKYLCGNYIFLAGSCVDRPMREAGPFDPFLHFPN